MVPHHDSTERVQCAIDFSLSVASKGKSINEVFQGDILCKLASRRNPGIAHPSHASRRNWGGRAGLIHTMVLAGFRPEGCHPRGVLSVANYLRRMDAGLVLLWRIGQKRAAQPLQDTQPFGLKVGDVVHHSYFLVQIKKYDT